MARLIDADEVGARIAEERDEYPPENNYDVGYHNGMTMAQSIVLAAPTIDAEPVVRCGECLFKRPRKEYGELHCCILDAPMNNNDFCSCGERRDKCSESES